MHFVLFVEVITGLVFQDLETEGWACIFAVLALAMRMGQTIQRVPQFTFQDRLNRCNAIIHAVDTAALLQMDRLLYLGTWVRMYCYYDKPEFVNYLSFKLSERCYID